MTEFKIKFKFAFKKIKFIYSLFWWLELLKKCDES